MKIISAKLHPDRASASCIVDRGEGPVTMIIPVGAATADSQYLQAAINDGLVMEDPDEPSIEDIRADGLTRVDIRAEAARLKFITAGAGQAITYTLKERELAAFVINPLVSPAEIPMMRDRAALLGVTIQAVSDEWSTRASAWKDAAAAIERIREEAKEAVKKAATKAGVESVLAGLRFPGPPA